MKNEKLRMENIKIKASYSSFFIINSSLKLRK